jgi:hypothetical protein
MVIQGTLLDLNNALSGLTFTPTTGFTGLGSVSILTNDLGNGPFPSTGPLLNPRQSGTPEGNPDMVQVVINPDHAPVNTVPGAQTINENNPLVFSAANSTAITVSDNPVDTGSNDYKVTLTAVNGTLTLASTLGLTPLSGSNGSASMSFHGTLAAINTALAGMEFDPTLNFFGSASVTINTDESTQTGTHGVNWPLNTTSSVAITVVHVNQPPVGRPESFSLGDQRTIAVPAPGVLANDFDVDSPTITAVLVSGPSNGTLMFNPDGSFTYSRNPTFIGTDSFTYRPFDGQALGNVVTVTIDATTPFNQIKAWVVKAYQDLLHVAVDPATLNQRLSELSSGLSRAQVALNIMDSQAYRTIVIQDLVKSLLNRKPKARELQRYTSMLATGKTVEFVSALILGSPEYVAKHGGPGKRLVRALFQQVEGKAPSRSDLALFSRLLAGGRSPTNLAVRIIQTVDGMAHTATLAFEKYLGRVPSTNDIAPLVMLLQTGLTDQPTLFSFQLPAGSRDEQIIAILVGSPEYFANV